MPSIRMTFAAGGTLLALAAAAPAAAQTTSDFLVKRPTRADEIASWPAAAKGQGGRAVMRCRADVEGRLSNCRTVNETPGGMGFGAALLSLASKFQVRADKDRGPEGQDVTIPWSWDDFDTPANWLKRPTARDLLVVWPTEAYRRGRGGYALINCVVTVQGALTQCVVVDEDPPGEHFGSAALALTPQFLMKPAMKGGKPVPSVASIPINFKMPSGGMKLPEGAMRRTASPVMVWPEAPSYADVIAAYPAKAKVAKVGGRATLSCELGGEGRLRGCQTVSEAPKGQGFAAAAKSLAKKFRAPTETPEGKSVRGVGVQIPVTFDPAMLEPGGMVVGRPSWAQLPTADDVKAAFGDLKLESTGRASLRCKVETGGSVSDCRVASETAAGLGAAALKLAPKFRLTTWTNEGLPTVGGEVTVPVRFEP